MTVSWTFPRIWILALSKADLFPGRDVFAFRDLMLWKAAEPVNQLRETIASLVETPQALSVGEDFLLLSSAEFTVADDHPGPVKIDVHNQVGLDLILPIASLLPLERLVQWHERMQIPRKVLDTVADGAEALAGLLAGGSLVGLNKVLTKLPRVGPVAGKAAYAALIASAKIAGDQVRKINAQARESQDFLTATVTQFRLDLDRGIADKLFLRSLK